MGKNVKYLKFSPRQDEGEKSLELAVPVIYFASTAALHSTFSFSLTTRSVELRVSTIEGGTGEGGGLVCQQFL